MGGVVDNMFRKTQHLFGLSPGGRGGRSAAEQRLGYNRHPNYGLQGNAMLEQHNGAQKYVRYLRTQGYQNSGKRLSASSQLLGD